MYVDCERCGTVVRETRMFKVDNENLCENCRLIELGDFVSEIIIKDNKHIEDVVRKEMIRLGLIKDVD